MTSNHRLNVKMTDNEPNATFPSQNLQPISHLKIETSLQQLVHSLRRQAAIGQEEGGECLIGSQVFFYWEIYSGTTNKSSTAQRCK